MTDNAGARDALIASLRRRYSPDPIPPCRICGAVLELVTPAATRSSARYACTYRGTAGSEHYVGSVWLQPNPGDTDLLALLDVTQDDLAASEAVDRWGVMTDDGFVLCEDQTEATQFARLTAFPVAVRRDRIGVPHLVDESTLTEGQHT